MNGNIGSSYGLRRHGFQPICHIQKFLHCGSKAFVGWQFRCNEENIVLLARVALLSSPLSALNALDITPLTYQSIPLPKVRSLRQALGDGGIVDLVTF